MPSRPSGETIPRRVPEGAAYESRHGRQYKGGQALTFGGHAAENGRPAALTPGPARPRIGRITFVIDKLLSSAHVLKQGKPIERWGRKISGLRGPEPYD